MLWKSYHNCNGWIIILYVCNTNRCIILIHKSVVIVSKKYFESNLHLFIIKIVYHHLCKLMLFSCELRLILTKYACNLTQVCKLGFVCTCYDTSGVRHHSVQQVHWRAKVLIIGKIFCETARKWQNNLNVMVSFATNE